MKRKNESGFTLVELAIVMIIFGFIMSIAFYALRLQLLKENINQTREALQTSESAMVEFRYANKRYPCPARPNLPQSNANYGKEDCAGATAVLGRDVDNADGDNNDTTGQDFVLIGAVPFVTMLANGVTSTKLTANSTVDGWGRKLGYAVTQQLTAIATFRNSRGGIDVIDENDNTLLDQAGTAHTILFSYGEDGRGAYTTEGQLVQSCVIIPGPPPVPPVPILVNETENCGNTDGTFLSGLRNETNDFYNDDIMQFLSSRISNHWIYVNSLVATNTNSGNVGVGTNTPDQRLTVLGDIEADQVQADMFCDEDGTTCMDPEAIAGNLPLMGCPPGRAATAIQDNQVVCDDIMPATLPMPQTCPPGQAVWKISNINGVSCAPLPPP